MSHQKIEPVDPGVGQKTSMETKSKMAAILDEWQS
jgi:hypothetical protein